MKQMFKRILSKILHPLIIKLGYGYRVKPLQQVAVNDNLLEAFYILLIKMNFVPNHIIDVGANHGNWTRVALKYFPNSFFTLLEPQNWLRDSLEDLLASNDKVQLYNVGAGSAPGVFKFTIAGRDDSSSFRFSEKEAQKQNLEQIDVEIVTLNEFISKLELPVPDIIKIDAEGLDVEVLKGSDIYFGKSEIFIVEAGIGSRNVSNSFLKVIQYMDENGYQLFEITDLNRPFDLKILWLTELVFIRKGGVIDSQILKINS